MDASSFTVLALGVLLIAVLVAGMLIGCLASRLSPARREPAPLDWGRPTRAYVQGYVPSQYWADADDRTREIPITIDALLNSGSR